MANVRIKACVFDAYGTLFDVHSAVAKHADKLGPYASEISKLWRTKQLEYSWVHSLMRRHVDFWELTGAALDYALAFHQVRDTSVREALQKSYLALDAYPEVASVLQSLRDAGIKTAVLSNGSPFMLERAVNSAGLQSLLDKCLSIEEAGIYKPDPAAYKIATRSLAVQPDEIGFFSSNPWDAVGAHTFGFRAFWVNRSGQPNEYDLQGRVPMIQSLVEAKDVVTDT